MSDKVIIKCDDTETEYRIDVELDAKTPHYSPSIPDHGNNQSSDEEEDKEDNYSPTYSPSYVKTPLIDALKTPRDDEDLKIEAKSPVYTPKPIEPLSPRPGASQSEKEVYVQEIVEEGENEFEGFDETEIDTQNQPATEGIIADIFGESDQEEEFEGFAENEVDDKVETGATPDEGSTLHQTAADYRDNDLEDDGRFVSDFDQYLEKKRIENSRKRRRENGVEFLNDSDDIIQACIKKMRHAAEADRMLFASGKPAVRKVVLVPNVIALMKKAGLKNILIENGMLAALTDWLSPLKGQTLPSLPIREAILKALEEFKCLPADVLKESGIGKAIMYLYKHPKETKENKTIAGKLINEWCRPIFNLQSDYQNISKEERRKLTAEQLPRRRTFEKESAVNHTEPEPHLKPGDDGFINRARVPEPSRSDYVITPKWNLPEEEAAFIDRDDNDDTEDVGSFKRKLAKRVFRASENKERMQSTRLESNIRQLTKVAHVNAKKKFARAINMSIEGRKMPM
ncbi:Transcription factor iws1 [Cichlidogyrus casuarinus]|uniref:Transcription factor iws1 n=1 Tax=Cichlidogyrus casuarinus TaxID=1844966 RepID=A0ABD2QNM8_9PLAT